MYDDGQFSGDGDLRLLQAVSFGEPKPPRLERGPFLDARQQRARRLEQIRPDRAVAAFGDSAALVDLARLIAARRETEVCTNATGQTTQTAPGLRVYVHGGVLAEMVPGSADRGMAPYEGDFIWQDAGQTRVVKNTGTTLIEFVEFELK
jgi:hypothetical protein